MAEIAKRFVDATSALSLRDAGALGSVSHQFVGDLRRWVGAGADPADLWELKHDTVQGMADYLEIAGDIEHRRRALTLAADRLERLAKDLRREASNPRAEAPPGATPPPELGGDGGADGKEGVA